MERIADVKLQMMYKLSSIEIVLTCMQAYINNAMNKLYQLTQKTNYCNP